MNQRPPTQDGYVQTLYDILDRHAIGGYVIKVERHGEVWTTTMKDGQEHGLKDGLLKRGNQFRTVRRVVQVSQQAVAYPHSAASNPPSANTLPGHVSNCDAPDNNTP